VQYVFFLRNKWCFSAKNFKLWSSPVNFADGQRPFTPKTTNMTLSPDEAFEALGLELPPAAKPMGVYKPCLVDGLNVYLSGHGPLLSDNTLITGRVGDTLTADQGKQAARQVALSILSTLRAHIGSFNKIRRLTKTLGMVNCLPDFQQHPYVINGCSELFAQIWGNDDGVGVRSAVGMGSLPGNIPVEIEVCFQLHENMPG
jgi:hypothetical protein